MTLDSTCSVFLGLCGSAAQFRVERGAVMLDGGCVGLVLDSLSEELLDIFIARAREAMEVRLVAVDAEHTVRHQHVGMNVERQRGIEPLHERDGAALDRDVDPLLSRALPLLRRQRSQEDLKGPPDQRWLPREDLTNLHREREDPLAHGRLW